MGAEALTIPPRGVGPKRTPAPPYLHKHLLDPNDIEIRLLLTGKARSRQIFCGCGRTDSDRNGFSSPQLLVGSRDGFTNACRNGHMQQGSAYPLSKRCQALPLFGVSRGKLPQDGFDVTNITDLFIGGAWHPAALF